MAERSGIQPNAGALTPSEIRFRSIYKHVGSIPIRTHIVAGADQLKIAGEYAHDTGNGVDLEIQHFSRTDPVHAVLTMAHHPLFKDLRIVAPFARHQVPPKWFPLLKWCKQMGVELFEVTTQNTIDRFNQKGKDTTGMKVGDGVEVYMKRAGEVMAGGGVHIRALQGERQPLLYPFDGSRVEGDAPDQLREPNNNMWAFDLGMRHAGVNEYGIIFMGFELPGRTDYGKFKGYNFFEAPYLATFGNFFERSEIGGRARDLNSWANARLAEVVRPNYLPTLVNY